MASYAAAISTNLIAALEGRNVSELAIQCGLARSTIYDLVSGRTWPELVSLAKLETALGVTLWPAVQARD